MLVAVFWARFKVLVSGNLILLALILLDTVLQFLLEIRLIWLSGLFLPVSIGMRKVSPNSRSDSNEFGMLIIECFRDFALYSGFGSGSFTS